MNNTKNLGIYQVSSQIVKVCGIFKFPKNIKKKTSVPSASEVSKPCSSEIDSKTSDRRRCLAVPNIYACFRCRIPCTFRGRCWSHWYHSDNQLWRLTRGRNQEMDSLLMFTCLRVIPPRQIVERCRKWSPSLSTFSLEKTGNHRIVINYVRPAGVHQANTGQIGVENPLVRQNGVIIPYNYIQLPSTTIYLWSYNPIWSWLGLLAASVDLKSWPVQSCTQLVAPNITWNDVPEKKTQGFHPGQLKNDSKTRLQAI